MAGGYTERDLLSNPLTNPPRVAQAVSGSIELGLDENEWGKEKKKIFFGETRCWYIISRSWAEAPRTLPSHMVITSGENPKVLIVSWTCKIGRIIKLFLIRAINLIFTPILCHIVSGLAFFLLFNLFVKRQSSSERKDATAESLWFMTSGNEDTFPAQGYEGGELPSLCLV